MGRGLFAVLALGVGLAALGTATVLIARDLVEARSQASPPTFSTPSTVVPPDTTTMASETTTVTETTTVAVTPTIIDVDFGSVVGLEDDSGRLTVSVPSEWGDVATGAWGSGGEVIGVRINAAVDREAWFDGWGTPGAFIGVTEVQGPDGLFGAFGGVCTYAGRSAASAGGLSAEVDLWVECGDERSTLAVVVAEADDRSFVMLIQVIVMDDDWHGYSAIMDTVHYEP
jgi:hypothetical protein